MFLGTKKRCALIRLRRSPERSFLGILKACPPQFLSYADCLPRVKVYVLCYGSNKNKSLRSIFKRESEDLIQVQYAGVNRDRREPGRVLIRLLFHGAMTKSRGFGREVGLYSNHLSHSLSKMLAQGPPL